MKYKKAFTLIEVLIAVVILATVATILLQISIRSKHNYSFYMKKQNFENISSIGLLHSINSNTNIYEIIRNEYKIKDFDTRRFLKSIKLKKESNKYSSIKLPALSDDMNQESNFKLNISQIKISTDKDSTFYYGIGL